LVAEAAGKTWLFTLGPAGGSTPGATKVTALGPIPRVVAPQYLWRINEATGPQGTTTPIHTHPGSEAFFVLSGEQTIRGPADLHALVMFVVDATRPFSSPATLP